VGPARPARLQLAQDDKTEKELQTERGLLRRVWLANGYQKNQTKETLRANKRIGKRLQNVNQLVTGRDKREGHGLRVGTSGVPEETGEGLFQIRIRERAQTIGVDRA